jgi:hypothetical protein
VNSVLGVAVVLTVGPIGVILATVVAESVRCLLHRALRQNDASVPVLPEPLREQLFAAAGMTVVMGSLSTVLPDTAAHQLGTVGTLGIATYLAVVLARDGPARRAIADFGVAARALVVD